MNAPIIYVAFLQEDLGLALQCLVMYPSATTSPKLFWFLLQG